MPYVQMVLAAALAFSAGSAVAVALEPSENSFWGEYEQKYKHQIEEEIDSYLDHKRNMFVISLRRRLSVYCSFCTAEGSALVTYASVLHSSLFSSYFAT